MNRFILMFFLLVIFQSSDNKLEFEKSDIIGNWYNYENTIESDINYTESFLGLHTYNIYQEVLFPDYGLFFKKDTLYSIGILNDTVVLGKPVFLDKLTLKITTRKTDKYIVLKRVIDTNTLEDFINQKIDEKTYYPSYLKRKKYWEQYGELPEDGDFDNLPKQK